MDELEKYKLINQAHNVTQLKEAITSIGDITISSGEVWSSELMCKQVDRILEVKDRDSYTFNMVSRCYNIRQQLIYLITYDFLD